MMEAGDAEIMVDGGEVKSWIWMKQPQLAQASDNAKMMGESCARVKDLASRDRGNISASYHRQHQSSSHSGEVWLLGFTVPLDNLNHQLRKSARVADHKSFI